MLRLLTILAVALSGTASATEWTRCDVIGEVAPGARPGSISVQRGPDGTVTAMLFQVGAEVTAKNLVRSEPGVATEMYFWETPTGTTAATFNQVTGQGVDVRFTSWSIIGRDERVRRHALQLRCGA